MKRPPSTASSRIRRRWLHALGGDPYGREAVIAEKHIDALVTVMGIGRKKCVILDLDGTLWPGVLAETGSPFAWTPEISGAFSFIGLYFGLHEALLWLKKRGIVLACVSKNDEATVRELWKYPDHYPTQRLLTPDDFVTWRVNWDDKVGNIRSIAEELGFALDTFLFIDDNPVERDRVRQRLPEVEVWGEDPFSLRRRLLNDPRLQIPVVTAEAASRSDARQGPDRAAAFARRDAGGGAIYRVAAHPVPDRAPDCGTRPDCNGSKSCFSAPRSSIRRAGNSLRANWRRWPKIRTPACLRSTCRIASAITAWSAPPSLSRRDRRASRSVAGRWEWASSTLSCASCWMR